MTTKVGIKIRTPLLHPKFVKLGTITHGKRVLQDGSLGDTQIIAVDLIIEYPDETKDSPARFPSGASWYTVERVWVDLDWFLRTIAPQKHEARNARAHYASYKKITLDRIPSHIITSPEIILSRDNQRALAHEEYIAAGEKFANDTDPWENNN